MTSGQSKCIILRLPVHLSDECEKAMTRYFSRLTVLTLLLLLLPAAARPDGGDAIGKARPSAYIGAQACGECHRDRFEAFRQTAHHLTSRLPDPEAILGSFSPEHAILRTRKANLRFEITAGDDGFFQTAIIGKGEGTYRRTERIDIVTGSGKIGQTYLFWQGNRLYQLPISYFAQQRRWVNSPGYPDGEVNFSRPVVPRCLECHATYFESASYSSNTYNRDHFVLGISCERCHGPGADHAAYQRAHPNTNDMPYILHPGRLEPQRLIDLCAQCHSGVGIPRQQPFSFRPGAPLNEYLELDAPEEQNKIGVHSTNQLPRLTKSRCFQLSQTMTCISCHNPHASERGNLSLFSKRCVACHSTHTCGMAAELGDAIRTNCIDCHMPRKQDLGTEIETAEAFQFPTMRDHFITIYPEISRRLTAQFLQTEKPPHPQPHHGRP